VIASGNRKGPTGRLGAPRRRDPYAQPGYILPALGSYDPNLDASERAVWRGVNDTRADTTRQGARDFTDYITGRDKINQDAGRSFSDLQQGSLDNAHQFDTNLAALNTARGRHAQDYTLATQNLARQFAQLGNQQRQSAVAGGASAGAFAQAARKRAENQGRGQSQLDTENARYLQDAASQETQLREGFARFERNTGIQIGRTGEDQSQAQGHLGLVAGRAGEDRRTTLQRALREGRSFSQDTAVARLIQAAQANPGSLDPNVVRQAQDILHGRKRRH
jgi:hypothetical protein